MKILLTGSGGFIGKNLKFYLQGKHQLLTPRSFELDLTNKEAVKEYFKTNDIDFIIHCGSIGGAREIVDKDTTIEDNLAMVDNILLNKKTETKIILFGSGAMYDKSRNLHKVKETEIGKFVPYDLYGKSKLLIYEKIKDRNDVLMLNIFACYGYDEKENRFPSYAINQIIKGENININQNVIFDYLFVEDLEQIVEYFISNKPQDNIINITPTKSIKLTEIAQIVNTFGQKPVDIVVLKSGLNNEYSGDNSLLLKNYPECKFTPVETGLKRLYEYNNNRRIINEKHNF